MATPAPALLSGSLPFPRTRLIGRESERAIARTLLLDEAVPLLTLTGPGGIGKTRLALAIAHEVADHFADGVSFVDLALISDAALVTGVVARAVGAAVEAAPEPEEQLAAALHPRQLLLVLDNCEHLRAPVGALTSRLLTACPALQVLATSRAPLRLRIEHELPVPPLSLSDFVPGTPVEDAGDAVALFVERARVVRPGFTLDATTAPTVATMCRRLDGLPLAIELAASWTRLLPPDGLLERLSRRVLDLAGGARDLPTRQQTLRDTIAWSHDLLGEDARALFGRLGAFIGGFDLEAAEAVGAIPGRDLLPGLATLVEQSLVSQIESAGASRFVMLETIRTYAEERLTESGEEAAVRAAHAAYFLALAEDAEPHLRGPDQYLWLDRLEREHPNLRQALRWYRVRGELEQALRLAGALGRFWEARGHAGEGRAILDDLLHEAALDASFPPATLAKALSWVGTLTWIQGDFGTARERHQAALALYEEIGDERGAAFSLNCIGAQSIQEGNVAQAEPPIQAALERYQRLNDAWGIGTTLLNVGVIAQQRGHLAAAERVLMESLTHVRLAGDPAQTAYALAYLGSVAHERGDHARARLLLQDALAQLRAGGDAYSTAFGLYALASVLRDQGEHQAAAVHFREMLQMCRDLGDRLGIAQGFEAIALNLAALGLHERALRTLAAATQIREVLGVPPTPSEETVLRHGMARVQEALGTAKLASLWTAASTMPIERVVAEILTLEIARGNHPGAAASSPATDYLIAPEAENGFGLTRREREILELLTQRLTDLEIAERLFISPKTTGHHVSNILSKLEASNRRDAAAIAARLALV